MNRDPEKFSERAYELGYRYEKTFRGCGQCFMAAIYDTLELPYDELFKSLSGFAGGVGMVKDGNCAAYIGSALFLGKLVGRERDDFEDKIGRRFEAYRLARKIRDRFMADYGSISCGDIQMRIFGRQFDLLDPNQMALFDKMGGHSDKCPEVVGRAAAWLIQVMEDEGLLSTFYRS